MRFDKEGRYILEDEKGNQLIEEVIVGSFREKDLRKIGWKE